MVKVVGSGPERFAVVCFKKPEDVEKALEVSKVTKRCLTNPIFDIFPFAVLALHDIKEGEREKVKNEEGGENFVSEREKGN